VPKSSGQAGESCGVRCTGSLHANLLPVTIGQAVSSDICSWNLGVRPNATTLLLDRKCIGVIIVSVRNRYKKGMYNYRTCLL